VLAAVQQYGFALEYAAESFKADRDFVLAAVQQYGFALEYAAESFKADRDFVLAAVQQSGFALHYAAESLKADRGIVLAAVQQSGFALHYADESLKADRDVVLAAVQQNGEALQYAAEPLKADRGIVLVAMQQNGLALQCVTDYGEIAADIAADNMAAHIAAVAELEAAASSHDRDLTLIAPAPESVTELESAASAQPSTSQSSSADEHDGAPVPLARVAPRRTRSYTQQATEQAKADKGGNKADPIIFGDSDDETSAEVKHDIDKIDEARYAELRRHYCEAYEEHDAPTLAGTSGARLRHKRKCRARIESDSGYKALHKMIKQLDRISNHAEVYRLLSLLYEYEVHLAPRGIARPAALGGGAPADEVAEVVDLIGEENDIINVDTYILDVLRDKRDEQQVGGAAGPSSAAPLSAGDADGATRVKQERE